jgi:Squalene-hopene cyclase C-terminal domain
VYCGALNDGHLRAVIRVALRAHGFTVSRSDVDRAIKEQRQLGCWLRDEALPERFPDFVEAADYRALAKMDPCFWNRLPYAACFGYQQAAILEGLAAEPSKMDDAAILAAAFSAGISLLDSLIDEHAEGMLVYETLNRDVVRRMFEHTGEAVAALARAYRQAENPGLRLLCALVATCANGFHSLYSRSGNEAAWSDLAQLISRLYEAERCISLTSFTSRQEIQSSLPAVEAKSVLPFVATLHILMLARPQSEELARWRCASETLGRIILLTDDLVDLLSDSLHKAPSTALLRLADKAAGRGSSQPSDTDVYDVVDVTVQELLASLQPDAFQPSGKDSSDGHSEGVEAHDDPSEGEVANPGLAALIDFTRLMVARWVGWDEESAEATPFGSTDRGQRTAQSNPTMAATRMLLAQQQDGYQEAIHHLSLPRLYPEGPRIEVHPALLFQRALVLDSLLDARAAGHPVPQRVIDMETFTILRAKHRDVRGGWNYIPEVPELPPDADDLGIVLQVLCRSGRPVLASVCNEAIWLALAAAEPHGGFPTWILDPLAPPALDAAMRSYIEVTKSGGVHPDVVSNLLYGLILYDPAQFRDHLLKAVTYLEMVQDERGVWLSRRYAGPYYGTYRVVSVLGVLAPDSKALDRARTSLLQNQGQDGSWGDGMSDPLSTALAVLALTAQNMQREEIAIERGINYLIGTQEADGGWPASPFICFPIPAPDGVEVGANGVETYASRTITTAFCLKALLSTASLVEAECIDKGILSRAPWPTQPASSGAGWA